MRRLTTKLAAVALALLLAGAPAAAESDAPPKPAPEQKRVTATVEIRSRFEARDNADQRPANDLERFLGQRFRLSLLIQARPNLSFFVQGQDVWLPGAEKDKIIHDLATNLHQAYFDWKPVANSRWELRGGRQEFVYGEERLIGGFGWDNVGRSFDAARLRYQSGPWKTDCFGGRMVDVRRAGAPARAAGLDLYGVYSTRPAAHGVQTEFYGLFLRDGLRAKGELVPTAESTRVATLGFRRIRQPKAGWRYSLEHAWQFGRRGPDPHVAAMFVSSAGYAWGGRLQPRLGFEYDFASGDSDARDGRSREFHNLVPTNHPFYGYADLLGLRNMHGFRFTAAARLHARLGIEADYHRFLLAAERGPWKNAAGRVLGSDASGRSGRNIGQEVDLTFRVTVSKQLSLLAGYSLFVPGAFASRTRGPETHSFGYIQSLLRF